MLTTRGTRKRIQVYGRTQAETHQKLTKMLAQDHRGEPVAAESWKLATYLDYWLTHVVAKKRPKTYVGYRGVVDRHIAPALGRKRIDKLSARDVRLFILQCEQKCVCCANGVDAARAVGARRCCAVGACCDRRLSPRMIQFIHAVLRNALESAVREELIPRNVARLVQVQTPSYSVGRGLSVDDARAVLGAAESDRLYALYVVALYLGLRRGELLGLAWADVDLDGSDSDGPRLEVRQTLQRVDGRLQLVPPKTRMSRRTVPLPGVVWDALDGHRKRQVEERDQAGERWRESGLVFTTTTGSPIEPDNLRRSWYRVREVLAEPTRFHDLRHTCVSLLLDRGVPPHVVREIVGHSAIDVTMTIYAHASLSEKRRAMARLDGRLS